MPYITKEQREYFDDSLSAVEDSFHYNASPGILNYIITSICLAYLRYKGESYTHYNDILGALEGCKLELYRRKISKYEDLKIKQNGDVV